MRKIIKSIDIAASPDRAFDFVTHPENLLSIWPSLVEVSNVVRREDGWNSFDFGYRMAGVRVHGKTTTVRVETNKLSKVKSEGGIPSTWVWEFLARGGGTHVNLDLEYTIPAPVLGKLAEAIVAKMNEHEIHALLQNLKVALEVAPTTAKSNESPRAHP